MKKTIFVFLIITSYGAGLISASLLSFPGIFEPVRDQVIMDIRETNIVLFSQLGGVKVARSIIDDESCEHCKAKLDQRIEVMRAHFIAEYERSKGLGMNDPFGTLLQSEADYVYRKITEGE